MKVLIFDLWGDYGHFKKFYTTTSPLTFPFPPRPTIAGILAAISGIDKDEYLQFFTREQAQIGIKLLSPTKKIRLTENFINTKDLKQFMFAKYRNHTQIRLELLKDPCYRIYFSHKDPELFSKILNLLREHKTVYTVSLGLSEFLADFRFIAECSAEKVAGKGQTQVNTAISHFDEIVIDFEKDKSYFSTILPGEMLPGRIVSEYNKVYYEGNGKPLICNPAEVWKVIYDESGNRLGENIVFL